MREQVHRQRQAYAELQARRRGCEEGGVIVLDSNEDDEVGPSSAPLRIGYRGRGAAETAEAPMGHATIMAAAAATTPITTGFSAYTWRAVDAAD